MLAMQTQVLVMLVVLVALWCLLLVLLVLLVMRLLLICHAISLLVPAAIVTLVTSLAVNQNGTTNGCTCSP